MCTKFHKSYPIDTEIKSQKVQPHGGTSQWITHLAQVVIKSSSWCSHQYNNNNNNNNQYKSSSWCRYVCNVSCKRTKWFKRKPCCFIVNLTKYYSCPTQSKYFFWQKAIRCMLYNRDSETIGLFSHSGMRMCWTNPQNNCHPQSNKNIRFSNTCIWSISSRKCLCKNVIYTI